MAWMSHHSLPRIVPFKHRKLNQNESNEKCNETLQRNLAIFSSAVKSSMQIIRCLLAFLLVEGACGAWISQATSLFHPSRPLSSESCRSCTWHECEINGWQFLPHILATETEAAAPPSNSLAMLADSVGKENFIVNARTGRTASLRPDTPKKIDAFDAMELGLF